MTVINSVRDRSHIWPSEFRLMTFLTLGQANLLFFLTFVLLNLLCYCIFSLLTLFHLICCSSAFQFSVSWKVSYKEQFSNGADKRWFRWTVQSSNSSVKNLMPKGSQALFDNRFPRLFHVVVHFAAQGDGKALQCAEGSDILFCQHADYQISIRKSFQQRCILLWGLLALWIGRSSPRLCCLQQ